MSQFHLAAPKQLTSACRWRPRVPSVAHDVHHIVEQGSRQRVIVCYVRLLVSIHCFRGVPFVEGGVSSEACRFKVVGAQDDSQNLFLWAAAGFFTVEGFAKVRLTALLLARLSLRTWSND